MIKTLIKSLIHILAALVMLPLTLSYWILSLLLNKDGLLSAYSQTLSLLPGKLGSYLRIGFYRLTLTQCDKDSVIGFASLFSQQDTSIESGVYIGPQCNIGRCTIGQNTLLGSGVHIMSGKGQHNYQDLSRPIKDQGGVFSKVSIGRNCWLGNGALVMADIGDNSIIGAGSVVTDPIPPNSIAVGNPAKVVKQRG